MSNPRKFSEKIQIQLQKQEEETRRFNEMMQEAQLVKVLYHGQSPNQPHHLHHPPTQPHQIVHSSRNQHLIPAFPPYRGGSLPNVNQMVNMQSAGIDLQNALDSLDMLRENRDHSPRGIRHPSPTPNSAKGRHFSPNKRPVEYESARGMAMPYLSPPDQNTHLTKRAHSDSALHQSANPHVHNLDVATQQQLGGSFGGPTRRSPIPDKFVDPNYLWGEHTKLTHRPKSCDIPVPVVSGYGEHPSSGPSQSQSMPQQQQPGQPNQPQQHLLSPTNLQQNPSNNPSSGSLPDLTNPAMNFPTLVSPLDPDDTQAYLNNSNQQMYMPNQIRAPNSHSSSTSPQNTRRMRGPDSNGLNGPQRKPTHSTPNPPYIPYQNPHLVQQSFNTYRSNSSSPGIDQLVILPSGSNPSSPGNQSTVSFTQDPHYLDMQQTVQHKFEQITMDHSSGRQQQQQQHPPVNSDPYANLFNVFLTSEFGQRNPGSELGQIPDIIFTGPGLDDATSYSTLLPPPSSSASSSNSINNNANMVSSNPFQHNHIHINNDPFSMPALGQDSVDLLDVLKLDQYDLGMLNDVNISHMVDPETEEQFRLDNNSGQ